MCNIFNSIIIYIDISISIVNMVQDTEVGNTEFYYNSHNQLIAGCSK